MTAIIDGSLGITAPTYNGTVTAEYSVPVTAFKNRIINGAMVIDQRNAGASVTPNNTYTLDRWKGQNSQSSKYTVQQNAGSVTPPVGFTNYLGVTSSSAYTITSTDEFTINQFIEGFNVADLNWGTVNAQTITVSFWVRSSLTGTFGGALKNINVDRGYPFTYTISSANTWEQKTITIAGDTTGTWNKTNSSGIQLGFGLGVGSSYSGTAGSWQAGYFASATGATSVVGTNGATFYITGVQLEKGSTATSFDYRPYGTELALCQRYLPAFSGQFNTFPAFVYGTTACLAIIQFPVPTRTAATGIYVSSAGHFISWRSNTSASAAGSVAFNASGTNSAVLDCTGYSASSFPGAAYMTNFQANSSSALLYFTGCEL